MRIHRFHGGLKLQGRYDAISAPIRGCPPPPRLFVPLITREGEIDPVVSIGDRVLRGQCVGEPHGIGARVHASASGIVVAIESREVASSRIARATCVVIEPDGRNRWLRLPPIEDWRQAPREILLERLHETGVAGLGGAVFPADIKLAMPVETLILNGAECEPGIGCDRALMLERAAELIRGATLLTRIAGARQTIIAIEDAMQGVRAVLERALREHPFEGAVLVEVPTRYPQGGERQLIETLIGREVPARGLPRDIGVLCHNVGTAVAAFRAIAHGEALTSRVVSVNGPGVTQPGNYEVRFGTPIAWLVEQAGGYTPQAARLVAGGAMMGLALPHDDIPIDASCNAIQVLDEATIKPPAPELPCIRCGECVRVCPARLLPQQLFAYLTRGDWPRVQQLRLDACIECGCCAVACPSQIPLVEWYRWGKAELREQVMARTQAAASRSRFDARNARLQRERDESAAPLEADVDNASMHAPISTISKTEVLAAIARGRARREARAPHHPSDDDGSAQ